MTYATRQLTQALQELTTRSQGELVPARPVPDLITPDRLLFSKEVEDYLEKKRVYAERTRKVSVGSY